MKTYRFTSGIPSEAEIKKIFKSWTDKEPQEFFPVEALKDLGFQRKKCKNCGRFFWEHPSRAKDVCGDTNCEGGYSFIGKAREENIRFTDVWKRFNSLFEKKGYTAIKRYPVVARWNPTTEFTIASITDFQPYVTSGEMPPPANPLIVPQICLRFADIDNVGITGRHYTGFTMIGQHAFFPKEEFNQDKYFRDYFEWFIEGMNLRKEEIVIHEDSWGGGGNFGACLEFFSGGLEIGNQVYPSHKITKEGLEEMEIKVLDMGMGQERCLWFLLGTGSSYDSVMPEVLKYLHDKANFNLSIKDEMIINKFLPYSGLLCKDETENPQQLFDKIANSIDIRANELRSIIEPWSALNAIAEHSRSLLYAIADGALPSNQGGGYNLRAVFRRAMSFIEKFRWEEIDLTDLAEIHARTLSDEYPELLENIDTVKKILNVEKEKYYASSEKRDNLIKRIVNDVKKGVKITTDDLIKYYDSFGIAPSIIDEKLKEQGISIEIPENFFSRISKLHESDKINDESSTKKQIELNIPDLSPTEKLYLNDYLNLEFEAKVIWTNGQYVVLDKTGFYPTSGGQLHDEGRLVDSTGKEYIINDVFKYEKIIVHRIKNQESLLKEGTNVKGFIDKNIRIQLSQHHTAAHIINGAARRVLGEHVWQAGAAKYPDKARLDITHYASLSESEAEEIERIANDVINENRKINKYFLQRGDAEKRFGFRIYQGGAVPEIELRIVEIENFDVEACGGTHLNSTSEAKLIKLIKSTKIQDGIVRIEFVAGNSAVELAEHEKKIVDELAKLLNCNRDEIIRRVSELFDKWKNVRKALKKGQAIDESLLYLTSKEALKLDDTKILRRSSEILSTQPEQIINTVSRFLNDLEDAKNMINDKNGE